MNANTSPSITPLRDRSDTASSKVAFGDRICLARMPLQLAGDRRKIRDKVAEPVHHDRWNSRNHDDRGDDAADEQPVSRARRLRLSGMTLEHLEVHRVRFPEHVRDVTGERNHADEDVDRDVDQHPQLHHARHAHVMRLQDDRAGEDCREDVANPWYEADQGIPAEANAGAWNAKGVVEEALQGSQGTHPAIEVTRHKISTTEDTEDTEAKSSP